MLPSDSSADAPSGGYYHHRYAPSCLGAAHDLLWRFRIWKKLSILFPSRSFNIMVSGALTTIESRGLEANLPTPFLGIWERINIGAYMIWVIVFASMLMNRNSNSVSKLKRG